MLGLSVNISNAILARQERNGEKGEIRLDEEKWPD